MAFRFLALSFVSLCVACGSPRPDTSRAPDRATAPEASPVAAAADEATCDERAWEVAAHELEETLRDFDELEPDETLTLENEEERERHCARRVSIPDLDGDGLEEVDLSAGCRWNKVWPHVLFLSRGCRFGGVVWNADVFRYLPRAAPSPDDAALPDIVTHSSNGCAGWNFTESRYRWTGTGYTSIAQVDCNLCEDPGTSATAAQPAACDRDGLVVSW